MPPDGGGEVHPNLTPEQEETRRHVQRRTLAVVFVSQILGGAGLAAGVSVGALLAKEMLGGDALSGLPTALFTIGAAVSAFLVGRFTQRLGRRIGLSLGFAAGGIGAVGVVVAAALDNVPLLLISLVVYGSGTATNLQARYAGTDLALPTHRGRAISVAMVSTTVGAVAGPNLIDPLGALSERMGVIDLAGPFMLAAVAYLAAGLSFFVLLRPDPFTVARSLDIAPAPGTGAAGSVPRPATGAYVGAVVMVLTQLVMFAIMTMTPVHMRDHHHGLGAVGLVISIHIAAMYLPSPLTGALIDRIGRSPVVAGAGVTLLLSGIAAAMAPANSVAWLVVALTLLGLGWNFGLIAGTALVVDATTQENRGRVQGTIDVLIALGGAGGGAASGVVMAATDFATLALGFGVLSLVLIPALVWARNGRRQPQ